MTMLLIGMAVGFVLYLGYLAQDVFFRVEEGHVAVVTTFGAARERDGGLWVLGPGLHRKWPWEKVHKVSLKEQALELTGEEGGQVVMADDGTVLRLDSVLRYQAVPGQLRQFLFGMRAPQEHITGVFTCLLRNEMANFTPAADPGAALARPEEDLGSYAFIRRERRLLNERIAGDGKADMEGRYGVRFSAVDLTDIHPPDELADALNAVMHARVEADALRARAQSECAQKVLAAREGVAIARTSAEAAAEEILALGAHLETLHRDGVLGAYVERRSAEVLSEARTVYLKDGKAVGR